MLSRDMLELWKRDENLRFYLKTNKSIVIKLHNNEIVHEDTLERVSDSLLHDYYEWGICDQEVSWQEAIIKWVYGMTVYCVNKENRRFILRIRSDNFCISREDILNGRWFIMNEEKEEHGGY